MIFLLLFIYRNTVSIIIFIVFIIFVIFVFVIIL